MVLTRGRAVTLLVLAIALVLALVAARTQRGRASLFEATGEESTFEGLKGVAALAWLQVGGPHPDLAPDVPIRHLATGAVGANTFLQLEVDPENVRRSLATMHDAGIRWARQQFPWEDIEIHGQGDFVDRRNEPARSAWLKYDRIVQMAEDNGIELLVRLDDPPEWAYADPVGSGDKGPPDDVNDYAGFVEQVVRRYCGRVKHYQLWNEPNIYPEWGERDVDPAGYAALLKAGAAAAREACPDVVIVSAALAQNTEAGGRNMDDLKYLEALYQAGWQADFDVLAAQAFGLFTGPTDHRVSADRANFGRMLLARDIMVRHGDAAKAVWITEMGWTSPPAEYPTKFGRVDEARRAVYTTRAYDRIEREWPWIGPAFLWFLRRPDDVWERAPEGYGFFRLLGPDWVETPTFEALRERAATAPLLHRGRHGLEAPAIQRSGPWRVVTATNGVAYPAGLNDAEIQFNFEGTGYKVVMVPPEGGATAPTLYVVVDGEAQAVTPTATAGKLTFGRQDLPAGSHLVIARVDAGEAWVERVDILAPDPPSPLAPLVRWLAVGVGTILVGTVVWWWWRRRRRRPGGAADAAAAADVPPVGDLPLDAVAPADAAPAGDPLPDAGPPPGA